MKIETLDGLNFLSELFVRDAPDAVLLCEYPSSNSPATPFKNDSKYIIHDPFPPPHPELMKVLGPHHLMCGWGSALPVASRLRPPELLLDHWDNVFSFLDLGSARPQWQLATTQLPDDQNYITLFPHESIDASSQLIPPDVNYRLHSKEFIAEIDCAQAEVLKLIELPCMVKLSHGYAGLGNFLLRTAAQREQMESMLAQHWPEARLVINSVIENVCGDFGAQFYLKRDGDVVWLGLTQQKFDANNRWCGGVYQHDQQRELLDPFTPFIRATAERLHAEGYHGLVGIDLLQTPNGELFLVDVNPRLTGISPFLMASRIFAREKQLVAGIYRASCRFAGTLKQLVQSCEQWSDGIVLVLSGYEEVSPTGTVSTIGHLSVSAESLESCERIFDELLKN